MSPVPEEDHDKRDSEDMDNIESPNLVIPPDINNSDDEEEEEDGNHGYQLLPMGPDEGNGNPPIGDSDSDDDSGMSDGDEGEMIEPENATGLVPSGLYPNFPEGELPSYLQVPDLPKTDKKEILWNQPRSSNTDGMDSSQIASIKSAMKGFDLPVCNVPEWAKHISEDKWKEQLLSRLSSNKSHTDKPSPTWAKDSSHSSESSLSETEKETG